jgi:transcriptional regulator with XRE-family HTH domain
MKDDKYVSLGERVKAERVRLNLTQQEVAERCEVTRVQWGRYERGLSDFSGRVLKAFVAIGADEGYITFGIKTDVITKTIETFLDVRKKQLQPLLEKIERSCINAEDEDVELVAHVAQHLRNTRLLKNPEVSRASAIKRLLAMSDDDFSLMMKL